MGKEANLSPTLLIDVSQITRIFDPRCTKLVRNQTYIDMKLINEMQRYQRTSTMR